MMIIKLCSVLGAQKSCSNHEIQQFDWLVLKYKYKKLTRKFYDFSFIIGILKKSVTEYKRNFICKQKKVVLIITAHF